MMMMMMMMMTMTTRIRIIVVVVVVVVFSGTTTVHGNVHAVTTTAPAVRQTISSKFKTSSTCITLFSALAMYKLH
jgi:hypothetical protein